MSSVLEKELTCSICTDILYDPVTFLDCLHSNCGSCAKSWFDSREEPTCPICREPVRDARPNATMSSLLEDFLNSNPDKKRTSEDETNCRKLYKPGDAVLGGGRRCPPNPFENVPTAPQAMRSPLGIPGMSRDSGSLLLNSWGLTGIGSGSPTVRFDDNNIQNHPRLLDPFGGFFRAGSMSGMGMGLPGPNPLAEWPRGNRPPTAATSNSQSYFAFEPIPRSPVVRLNSRGGHLLGGINAGTPAVTSTISRRRPGDRQNLSDLVLEGQSVQLTCDGCGKNINRLTHYECTGCNLFHLCIHCQRSGTTCRSPGPGHVFHPQRLMSSDRLQTGIFCSMCHEWADEDRNDRQDAYQTFFWHCETCNDGVWTYCQTCVRQGRCCSHPLSLWTNSRNHISAGFPRIQGLSQDQVITGLPSTISIQPRNGWLQARGYRRWTNYQCICDVCNIHIPSTHPWMHCNTCENFDACNSCARRLSHNSILSPAGVCPRNHALSILSPDASQGGTLKPILQPPIKRPDMIHGPGQEAGHCEACGPRTAKSAYRFPKELR